MLGAKVALLLVVGASGSLVGHIQDHIHWALEFLSRRWVQGHHSHFLHHEAAPWTKAHVAGREVLGAEFEMKGQVVGEAGGRAFESQCIGWIMLD